MPAIDLPPGRYLWNRGFLVLLLDSGGQPTHVCKVRPEGEKGARNEGRILPRLSQDPRLRGVVPPTLWKEVTGLQTTMMAHMPGVAYTTLIRTRTSAQWGEDVRTVLALAARVSESASTDPGATGARLGIAEETGEALERLGGLGVGPAQRRAVLATLEAGGEVPPMNQHGDLWPANLLVHGDDWCLLDFELFGTERVPLYDALHLTRTCMTARAGDAQNASWIDQVTGAHPDAVAARAILSNEARRVGVEGPQAVACLLHYLIAFAARCARLNLPDEFMAPVLREVHRAADLASDDPRALEVVFRPPASA